MLSKSVKLNNWAACRKLLQTKLNNYVWLILKTDFTFVFQMSPLSFYSVSLIRNYKRYPFLYKCFELKLFHSPILLPVISFPRFITRKLIGPRPLVLHYPRFDSCLFYIYIFYKPISSFPSYFSFIAISNCWSLRKSRP